MGEPELPSWDFAPVTSSQKLQVNSTKHFARHGFVSSKLTCIVTVRLTTGQQYPLYSLSTLALGQSHRSDQAVHIFQI